MIVRKVPGGYHTLTPYLVVKGAAEAIEFYKKAFGAEELMRLPGPDGRTIMHAELRMGDSRLMLTDECPEMGSRSPLGLGATASSILIYSHDVDALFKRAVGAGAASIMAPQDMFWGDRWCLLKDPFGHDWQIATHEEDLTPEEIRRRAAAHFACAGKG